MYILGLSCFFHDSSAALLKDGRVVAAIQEERLTRKKHDSSFPAEAVRYCLSSQGITIKEVDRIVFYEKPLLKLERLLYQFVETFPRSFGRFLAIMPIWFGDRLRLARLIKKKLGYEKVILFVEHHESHAASSFFCGPFERAVILTIDGVGEWATMTAGLGEGNKIRLEKEIKFPHSLGLFYSAITSYLGFSVNDSEYKVMGLSAYGELDKSRNIFYEKLRKVIDIKDDGSFRLDMSYFKYHYAGRMPSAKLGRLLGGPIRRKNEPIGTRHQDIAAALQLVIEEVMSKILEDLYKKYECPNIVLAGGVALNSVVNGKILNRSKFKNFWIQPNASDGGASLGAALFAWHQILGYSSRQPMAGPYLGREYPDQEIREFLEKNKIKYREFGDEQALIRDVARLIFQDRVVGWFQGREEWGPRALGARSILANPLNPKMKDILNFKVKHREGFRPFAPAVSQEAAEKYFEMGAALADLAGYMLAVCPVREEWRRKIPAVCHIDGTARPQVVRRETQPLYYDLIKEFGKISGVPILVNTSFNMSGDPIVSSLADAHQCFLRTEIDCLAIGKFLVEKRESLDDFKNN